MKKFRSGEYLIVKEKYDRGGWGATSAKIENFSSFKNFCLFIDFDIDEIREANDDKKMNQKNILDLIECENGDSHDYIRVWYRNSKGKFIPFIGDVQ